jgi:hypothetical protein
MAKQAAKPPVEPAVLELQFNVIRPVITRRSMARIHGKRVETLRQGLYAEGELRWGAAVYRVRSGPWGKGALTDGMYTVSPRKVVKDPAQTHTAGDGTTTTTANEGMRVLVEAADGRGGTTTRSVGYSSRSRRKPLAPAAAASASIRTAMCKAHRAASASCGTMRWPSGTPGRRQPSPAAR